LALAGIEFEIDTAVIGKDSVLKSAYWFSRDFHCHIENASNQHLRVSLVPKDSATAEAIATCEGDFRNTAIDFELRAKVEQKTSDIRELILAKAFAEAGVLEDRPEGKFADPVDESEPTGLFKILNSGQF
jgi:His-Xaa-Ser system protein HxsD